MQLVLRDMNQIGQESFLGFKPGSIAVGIGADALPEVREEQAIRYPVEPGAGGRGPPVVFLFHSAAAGGHEGKGVSQGLVNALDFLDLRFGDGGRWRVVSEQERRYALSELVQRAT